jgi:hypothetical protein
MEKSRKKPYDTAILLGIRCRINSGLHHCAFPSLKASRPARHFTNFGLVGDFCFVSFLLTFLLWNAGR